MTKIARIANRQSWLQRLERFKQANQTVAQFCLSEGVSVPSFYQWRRKLNPQPGTSDSQAAKFLPVQLASPSTAQPKTVLSLDLPGGVSVRLEVHCDQDQTP